MPIIRNRDFYTQMGPADVIVAGYFELNPDSTDADVDGMRVTPKECQIEEISDPAGGSAFRLTLPGTGELRCSGVCMNHSPSDIADPILWAKWAYNDSDRTLYINLRNSPGAGSSASIVPGDRVYFCAHVYPSSSDSPNIIAEP